MKRCPECNRTYADESFAFCLADGALLSAPFDPKEVARDTIRAESDVPTAVIPRPPETTQPASKGKMVTTIEATLPAAPNHLGQAASLSDKARGIRVTRWYIWILALVMGFGVCALDTTITRYTRDYVVFEFWALILKIVLLGPIGFIFGFGWPKTRWKWGIWLSAPFIISVASGNFWRILGVQIRTGTHGERIMQILVVGGLAAVLTLAISSSTSYLGSKLKYRLANRGART